MEALLQAQAPLAVVAVVAVLPLGLLPDSHRAAL
jgi:hypothetical protein